MYPYIYIYKKNSFRPEKAKFFIHSFEASSSPRQTALELHDEVFSNASFGLAC